MSTLLLRFAGPMQAWGADSRFDIRKTNREPTKSGVVGLLAAALGMRRDEPLDELAALRFGVRVDREGVLLRDYHTVEAKKPYVTMRYYLCDAAFLVGLYSRDEALMERLEDAVRHPAYPLFLGRRSCPPEGRLCLGLRDMELEEALRAEPLLVERKESGPERVRFVLDDPTGGGRAHDVPVSYSPFDRQYAYRAVRESWQAAGGSEHDPMQELR